MSIKPVSVHVVVVHRGYAEAILEGAKRVEARLLKHRRAPYGCVRGGERLYFKVSGGAVVASARVDSVRVYDDLTPKDVVALEREFDADVCGGSLFWAAKRHARYAVLIDFVEVRSVFFGPDTSVLGPGARRSAWRVLPASADVYPACLRRPRAAAGKLRPTG
ncbi:MAG: ASCH domain-containing protein [Planctomycetota bacterium]